MIALLVQSQEGEIRGGFVGMTREISNIGIFVILHNAQVYQVEFPGYARKKYATKYLLHNVRKHERVICRLAYESIPNNTRSEQQLIRFAYAYVEMSHNALQWPKIDAH